jgi:ubiquinone/menaquinone biosynthesis C-methylase UbiE
MTIHVDAPPSFDLIDDMDIWGLKLAALRTAIELDLFGAMAAGAKSWADVARAAKCAPRAARVILDALCPMGLVRKDEDAYYLNPTSEAFLVRGRPAYCADALLTFWRGRDQLTKAGRTGSTGLSNPASTAQSVWAGLAAVELATWRQDAEVARRRWAQVDVGRQTFPGAHLLDLACGSGLDGLVLAQDDYSVHVTAVDFAQVLAVTVQLAAIMGVRQQVTFRHGDLLTLDLPRETYDLARLGAILYYFDPRQVRAILDKTYAAMRPNGLLVISSLMADEGRCQSEMALLLAVEFLHDAPRGEVYTFTEYRGFLQAAGFAEVTKHSDYLISARKPPA